jgi:NitT/TauT family transport system ATP-binding protein
MTPLLRVDIARKAFGGQDTLADIRFELSPCEIVAITGPSGCGKSTLLRLVAGLDRDFSGTMAFDAAMPRLAIAFQEPRLLPWRSVRDNLLLAAVPPATADALLSALALAAEAGVMADRLSLGMARRVAFARALAPELLLLDEPFASLDPAAAAAARELLLREWTGRPFAVLLVTHDLTEAAALADRILVLSARPARIARQIDVPAASRRGGLAAAAAFAASL